ncbi:hypothetical protein ABZU75_15735 [Streptosporangium sp. NPDC005286]|uniref:hypothetical protein n=1 Tax=Streptosporangium sp. NPDC005286 TaxID=3154463 RepID=UPI0033B2A1DD
MWHPGVRQAIGVWTVDVTVRLLPRTADDKPLHPTRRPTPTMRQLLTHRWEMASTLNDFPAFSETMRLLLAEVAGGWNVSPLPGYPAFNKAMRIDVLAPLVESAAMHDRFGAGEQG